MKEKDNEICKSCGRLMRDHFDEYGYNPCFESIIDTIVYRETEDENT